MEHMTTQLGQLELRIRQLADRYPFAVHWQIRDLSSGHVAGDADRTVLGAFSTRKVCVLLACLALVQSGRLSLDDTYTIDEQLKDGVQAGIMRNLSAGIELTLRDHLAQMMITSDNICTQLVFQAIEDATGDALQSVNDYCAQVGMYDTLHREIFPRSGQLPWSHSIESMTVTSAHDQALLLEKLAYGCTDEREAAKLGLNSELCGFAVELMGNLFTPMLGARLRQGVMAEKNGRGIRGLSQVGLLLDVAGQPVASVAVFAEHIPVELMDGTPGRARAIEFFAECGQVIEHAFLSTTPDELVARQVVVPNYWEQEFGELLYSVEGGRAVNDDIVFTFSGVGKLFFACTLAELEKNEPGLFDETIEITDEHRAQANTGSLRHLTGALQVSVDDALRLMIASGDGSVTLALLGYLHNRGVDVLEQGRRFVAGLPNTTITGVEDRSSGEGFTGYTTVADLLIVLRQLIDHNGRVKEWMSSVFEPAGLACALPGYGPHTAEHWTISGWARLDGIHAHEGRTSVLILRGPRGLVPLAAHAPVGTMDVPAKFGSLGLSALAHS
ncbi:hypothetical protein GCM10027092_16650 [Yaniella soli]